MPTAEFHDLHHSSVVMFILLVLFALIHSGGAASRSRAEAVIGARAWRLIFATASIPSAVIVIGRALDDKSVEACRRKLQLVTLGIRTGSSFHFLLSHAHKNLCITRKL